MNDSRLPPATGFAIDSRRLRPAIALCRLSRNIIGCRPWLGGAASCRRRHSSRLRGRAALSAHHPPLLGVRGARRLEPRLRFDAPVPGCRGEATPIGPSRRLSVHLAQVCSGQRSLHSEAARTVRSAQREPGPRPPSPTPIQSGIRWERVHRPALRLSPAARGPLRCAGRKRWRAGAFAGRGWR